MRIGAKLNLIVILAIVGSVIAIGVVAGLGLGFAMVKDMGLQATRVAKELHQLTESTQVLLLTERPLELKRKAWRNEREDVEQALENLREHPATRFVPSSIRESLGSAVRMWELSTDRFDEADTAVSAVLALEEIPEYSKVGIMPMLLQYRQQQPADTAAIEQLNETREQLMLATSSTLGMFSDNLSELSRSIATYATRASRTGLLLTAAIIIVVLALSVIFALTLTRRIAGRVRQLENSMSQAAQKDISVRSEETAADEIGSLGRHLNDALESLSELVERVKSTMRQVDELRDTMTSSSVEATASLDQITNSIDSIRQQFERVDSNIAQTTQAIGEIDQSAESLASGIESQSATIAQSSASIQEMNQSLENVSHVAQDRKQRAETLVQAIDEGGETLENTNRLVTEMADEIEQMLSVVAVINDVAEQTNLLSLNAAIESAHAGEAGKGFAVVAGEIRELAESTSQHADQINAALESIAHKVKQARASSSHSAEDFSRISREVRDFADALREVSREVNNVFGHSRQVAGSSESVSGTAREIEQSARSMRERTAAIRDAMNDIQQISRDVTNGVEEISTGAREVLQSVTDVNRVIGTSNERIEELTGLMAAFRTGRGNGREHENGEAPSKNGQDREKAE